jgi:8-oxo-dGTP pyrophosphatase MutT (NUDIX family)
VPTLGEIREALARHRPRVVDLAGRHAAGVAMVLRGDDGAPEVLLIERARRAGDPWSGHMAFPGGRVEPSDPHARAAAERETLEEVGLSLVGAEALGRLDDLEGHSVGRAAGLVVCAFVYHLPDPPELAASPEVEEALWVPLHRLRDPARQVPFRHPATGAQRFRGIVVGHPERQVVWGLTYRFLEGFFRLVERPLPG